MPKVAIGIITYGESTAKYLPYFLDSLKAQTFKDFQLIAFDNTEDGTTANSEIIAEKGMAAINLKADKNVGFGKAYNRMIAKAIEMGAEYLLALNPDMIVEQDMLHKLVNALDNDSGVGAIAPKILRWNFDGKQKTDSVDSYGLTMDRYFRFFDAFQGQPDSNQINDQREIFGFTGAAVLLRLKALEEIRFNDEYFDEFMFMYKEDCDLSLRIRLAGWKIMIEPNAVAFHDRTAANVGKSLSKIASGRRLKSPKVKQWSFLNQLILLYKYSHVLPLGIRLRAWAYEILSIGYAAIFETYLLKELIAFNGIRKQLKEKTNALKIRATPEDIEKFV